MQIRDVMHSVIIQIRPQATLAEAAVLLSQHGVNTLLVMDQGQLIGLVGLQDLFTAPRPARNGSRVSDRRTEQQLLEIWHQITVDQLVSAPALTVPEDYPLMKAAALMINDGDHLLAVTRSGQVVGVAARIDVVRGLLGEASA